MFPAGPDRTDGVYDESSCQTISGRDFSFAGTTTAQRAAVGEQFGACGAVNRAIDAATAEERCVRRVHDGINVQFSDVALDDLDSAIGVLHQSFCCARMTTAVGRLCQTPWRFTETPYNFRP